MLEYTYDESMVQAISEGESSLTPEMQTMLNQLDEYIGAEYVPLYDNPCNNMGIW